MKDKPPGDFWRPFWATLVATILGLLVYDQVKDIPNSAIAAIRSGRMEDALVSLAKSLWAPHPIPGLPGVLFALLLATICENAFLAWRAGRRASPKPAPTPRPQQQVAPAPAPAPARPTPARVAPQQDVPPQELDLPPPPPVGELDDRERRALMILYHEHPAPVALRQLAGMIGYSYGRGEQLAQKLGGLQLVDVVRNPYHGVVVVLTERGRDLCIERGIAHH